MFRYSLDVVGHDIPHATLQRGEEIPVGTNAQSLFPRIISRLEIWVMGNVLWQRPRRAFLEYPSCSVGKCSAEFEEDKGEDQELPADELECKPVGEDLAYEITSWVDGWHGQYIARRTLEHGNL